ncbi:MAG TPA: hypothetical protein VH682_26175 [Gemmataceae bacterium]|jgi:hypothetical protein
MNTFLRTASVAVVWGLLALLVLGLRYACNPADWSAILQRREDLDQLEEATLRRGEARQRVVDEVIDGRRTLAEAIEEFQELDREWPDYSEVIPAWAESRQEIRYRCILAMVKGSLRDRPEELSALLRRLEHEYQQRPAGELTPPPAMTKRTEQSR